MKILLSAPIMSPSFEGYYSFLILQELKLREHNVSLSILNSNINIRHFVGNEFESTLNNSLPYQDSNNNLMTKNQDLHIIISTWKQAWSLLVPELPTIVIGIDRDPYMKAMLANSIIKVGLEELELPMTGNFAIKKDVSNLYLHNNYRFIFPNQYIQPEVFVQESLSSLEKNERVLYYYPSAYFNIEALVNLIKQYAGEDLPVDIYDKILTHEDIRLLFNAIGKTSTYMGYNFDIKYNLFKLIEDFNNFNLLGK